MFSCQTSDGPALTRPPSVGITWYRIQELSYREGCEILLVGGTEITATLALASMLIYATHKSQSQRKLSLRFVDKTCDFWVDYRYLGI